MMTKFLTSFFIFWSCHTLYAQDSTRNFSYELSGGVSYSYSHLTSPPYGGETFSRYTNTHDVYVSPTIGYFLTPHIEILFAPGYTLQVTNYNLAQYSGGGSPPLVTEQTERRTTHNVGVSIGIAYNMQLAATTNLFLGTKIGRSWTWSGVENTYFPWNTGWSKPELLFPQIIIGNRIFFEPSWALVIQAQYTFINYYRGKPEHQISKVALGVGLAAFL